MRKILSLLVLVSGASFFATLPASAQDSLTINRISALEKKMGDFEKRLAKLEHQAPVAGTETISSSATSPVAVALLDKILEKANRFAGDTADKISFTLQISNNGPKDIRGFWGDVLVKNKSNKTVAAFVLKYDRSLRAGETTAWTGSIDFNKKFNGHVTLVQTDKKDLSVELKAKAVNYTDGSSEVFGVKK